MSDLTITTRSASEESRQILILNDLPAAVRDRVLVAAYQVAISFGNCAINELEPHAEAELEELSSAICEMVQYAIAAGPRARN